MHRDAEAGMCFLSLKGEYFDDRGKLNTSDFGAETRRKKWFILFHVVIFSLITIMWAEAEWNSMRKILKLRVHTLPLLSAIFQCLPFVLLALTYLLYSVAWFDSHIKLLRVTSLTEFLDDYADLSAARDLDDYTKRKNKFILSRWVIISLFTAWFGWEFTKEFSILPELSFLSAFFQCLPYVIVALMYVFFSIVFFASFERAPKEDPLKIT
ncbi:hypothetical protein OIU85_021688 [Salix viminalis]|uniref:Uncharacterized protein n=1 Tax=Salix viminalis TaxID=40686 RepID=A0A9Q0ZE19_SALVM|nr:hypothetical protein OIU85_021688 [Salix viminalis]